MLLACCGGFTFMGWQVNKFFKNAVTDDPAQVRARTAEIVDLTIPGIFKPASAVNMLVMQMVSYKAELAGHEDGTLILMELNKSMIPDEAAARKELEKQFQEQARKSAKTPTVDVKPLPPAGQNPAPANKENKDEDDEDSDLEKGDASSTAATPPEEIVRQTKQSFQIRGKEVPFDFVEFKGKDEAHNRLQVTGFFSSKNGYCQLTLNTPKALLSADEIVKMLQSIK